MKIIVVIFIVSFVLIPTAGCSEDAPFAYDDHLKRDPFWPLVTSNGSIVSYEKTSLMVSDMILEGIVEDKSGVNIAIINNSIVRPKDSIGEYVIEKIENDKVILIKGNETFTLKVTKED